jgi:hypothetical protein
MSELILKFNQLDDFGKTTLVEFLNRLLQLNKKKQPVEKPEMPLDYQQFQFPIAQLKFDRDEMNARD